MEEFQIVYTNIVVLEDIPALSSLWGNKIKRAIETRLTKSPERYGKPLRNVLANYRKLRVGDYRVIFRIEGNKVKIFLIAHRKDAYRLILNRI
ncbi:MAG TPA: type II toxin-antitoxin system RelE/ParE family toxin [Candidatus Paceibacterota bacterium]